MVKDLVRTDGVGVRPAAASDLPLLAELWQEKMILLQQSDPRFADLFPGNSAWEQAVCAWLEDARCAVLVAERDGRLVGCIIVWSQIGIPLLADQIGVVTDMILDSHAFHGGLARSLLQAARNWLHARGIRHMLACAPHLYAAEQAFWRAQGATQWIDMMWVNP